MSHKQILYSLLAENKIAQVITELRSNTEGVIDLHDEVLQLSARFQQNEKKRRLDLSDNEDVNREYNKIREGLISVIKRLPDPSIVPLVKKGNCSFTFGITLMLSLIAVVANIGTIKDAFFKKEDNTVTQLPTKKEKDEKTNSVKPTTESVKPTINPTQAVPKPTPIPPKYVLVTLVVDATFSNADIFANGKTISPLSESTLSIKKLEIEYENSAIELVLKTSNAICRKNITIPNNYFNNPIQIEVICTQ